MRNLSRITWVCLFSTACSFHARKAENPEISPPIDDRPSRDTAVVNAPIDEPPDGGLPADNPPAAKDEAPAGDSVKFLIRLGETAHPGNGLALTLTSFSHKRPMVGGPTKATAYLRISRGEKVDEITLSQHGVEGKTEADDGLRPEERYDTVQWESYEIRLMAFDYDESIEVRIEERE